METLGDASGRDVRAGGVSGEERSFGGSGLTPSASLLVAYIVNSCGSRHSHTSSVVSVSLFVFILLSRLTTLARFISLLGDAYHASDTTWTSISDSPAFLSARPSHALPPSSFPFSYTDEVTMIRVCYVCGVAVIERSEQRRVVFSCNLWGSCAVGLGYCHQERN